VEKRLNWMGSPATRWARNIVAACLFPYMLWLIFTQQRPGLLVSGGILILGVLALAVRAGREKTPA